MNMHLPSHLKDKRNQTILQMRKEGYSLQKIGDKFCVSREWIRLILKREFGITKKISYDFQNEVQENEYTVKNISELTGFCTGNLKVLSDKGLLPKPSRKQTKKSEHKGIDKWFWNKTDIDRWIEIRRKYLKIHIEKSINNRLGPPAPYKFQHDKVQSLYKLLQIISSDFWKGNLTFSTSCSDKIMDEFKGVIKPIQYVSTDYSKYLNMRTNEQFAEKGLYNGMKTKKIIGMSLTTIAKFREKGVLKEGIHYFTGDHYFQRYMYNPEKTKKAIIDAGFDLKLSKSQKKRWSKTKSL